MKFWCFFWGKLRLKKGFSVKKIAQFAVFFLQLKLNLHEKKIVKSMRIFFSIENLNLFNVNITRTWPSWRRRVSVLTLRRRKKCSMYNGYFAKFFNLLRIFKLEPFDFLLESGTCSSDLKSRSILLNQICKNGCKKSLPNKMS